jgi:hypothetical protein
LRLSVGADLIDALVVPTLLACPVREVILGELDYPVGLTVGDDIFKPEAPSLVCLDSLSDWLGKSVQFLIFPGT